MPSTNDPIVNKGLFALFKGKPNTAKSGAAYSFPNPFVLDFDRKMPTVAIKHNPGKEFNWETFDDIYQLSDYMKPYVEAPLIKHASGEMIPNSKHKPFPYETLIVDSVTSLSTLVLLSVDKTKGTSVIEMMSKVNPKSDTIDVMGIDYYNNETNFFERYFMNMCKLLWSREGNPKHVIVIAHEMVVDSAPDLKTKLVTTTKSILTAGRKAAEFIPSRFDDEYVFETEPPAFGDKLSSAKRICITSGKDNARCGYKFPVEIDYTNKSLYDELNKVAKWS